MTSPAAPIALTVNGQRTECTVRPRLLLTELLRGVSKTWGSLFARLGLISVVDA